MASMKPKLAATFIIVLRLKSKVMMTPLRMPVLREQATQWQLPPTAKVSMEGRTRVALRPQVVK